MKKYKNKISYYILLFFVVVFFTPITHAAIEETSASPSISITDTEKDNVAEAKESEKSMASDTAKKYTSNSTPKVSHQLTNYGASITEMLFYLLLVVGLIFFLAWLVKKMGYNNASQTHLMKVTACLPLTAKEKLMVVQIGDKHIVIGVAPGFVGHITSLNNFVDNNNVTNKDIENTLSSENTDTNSFSNMLSRIIKDKTQNEK
jgi:flagellar biosynthetic protein FliO